ncbi:MAG: signal peptidase I [Planctomycetota bacterium]
MSMLDLARPDARSDETAAARADAMAAAHADLVREQTGRTLAWPSGPRPSVRTLPPARRAPSAERGALWRNAAKFACVALFAYAALFNFSVVRGSSMSPGIKDGDRILVDHWSYMFQDVHRGDIVVLRYPLDPSLDYIKRVIGLPGETVRIEHGRVSVDGRWIDEPYVDEIDPRTAIVMRIESDSYFVLGDNRAHSSDSREFGLVPRENLRGKVDLRVWPPERMGRLH